MGEERIVGDTFNAAERTVAILSAAAKGMQRGTETVPQAVADLMKVMGLRFRAAGGWKRLLLPDCQGL
jgi:hypothetical protein